MAGVAVSLVAQEGWSALAVTDALGHFDFVVPPHQVEQLFANAGDGMALPARRRPNGQWNDLELTVPWQARGRLVWDDGTPVAFVSIEVAPAHRLMGYHHWVSAAYDQLVTDAQGRFTFVSPTPSAALVVPRPGEPTEVLRVSFEGLLRDADLGDLRVPRRAPRGFFCTAGVDILRPFEPSKPDEAIPSTGEDEDDPIKHVYSVVGAQGGALDQVSYVPVRAQESTPELGWAYVSRPGFATAKVDIPPQARLWKRSGCGPLAT